MQHDEIIFRMFFKASTELWNTKRAYFTSIVLIAKHEPNISTVCKITSIYVLTPEVACHVSLQPHYSQKNNNAKPESITYP